MKHHSIKDVTVSLYPYSFDLHRRGGETLWREVCVVQHWLVPGQLVKGEGQLPHMHCGAAIGGPWGTQSLSYCTTSQAWQKLGRYVEWRRLDFGRLILGIVSTSGLLDNL